MNRTTIEWTDWTANPLKLQLPDGSCVNACVKCSPGCSNCYAESVVRLFWKKTRDKFPGYKAALLKLGKPVLVEEELAAVLKLSERIASGKFDPTVNKVFWNDVTDEYLQFWPDQFLDRIWAVRALTPNLVHQVLTKRPERMARYLNNPITRMAGVVEALINTYHSSIKQDEKKMLCKGEMDWPLPNVWLGTSIENKEQKRRMDFLSKVPAAVRFLSLEPLLEDLGAIYFASIDWVIVGGESGAGARACNVEWVRSIVNQCDAADVACFVKQLGSYPTDDRQTLSGKPRRIPLTISKGGGPSEWPEDLRVREYPEEVPCHS